MNNSEILKKIDLTLLKNDSNLDQINSLCKNAYKYKTASVCIPPTYVKYVHKNFSNLNICTVVGFPLGYSYTDVKLLETDIALKNGASEIDMVINICDLKNKNFAKIENEIKKIKKICNDKILKVIIETSELTNNEKIEMCKIITNSRANYIKTSTGFSKSGANFDDIKLFKEYIGASVKIKAAGGIKTKIDMEKYITLGVSRIGASAIDELI